MALQKTLAENDNAKYARLKLVTWISDGLEVIVNTKISEQRLLNHRKTLFKQLVDVNKKLNNGLILANNEVSELEIKKNAIQHDIEMRNKQIADILQKILDANSDDKLGREWNCIQTMQDAKCALKFLFETAVGAKVELYLKLNKMSDLKISDLKNKCAVDARENDLRILKVEAVEEEMKISGVQSVKLVQDDTMLEKENEMQRMQSLLDNLQEKIPECATLKKDLKTSVEKLVGTRCGSKIAYGTNAANAAGKVDPNVECQQKSFELSPADMILGNPVGTLQEMCMARNWPLPAYDVIDVSGPPHIRVFTMSCTIKEHKECGSGKTKKLAKSRAAYKMLHHMKDMPTI